MIDIQSNSFLKHKCIKSTTVVLETSKHRLFISRQMHHIKIGVSMGWSGLGLCPTWTRHDHFRWRNQNPSRLGRSVGSALIGYRVSIDRSRVCDRLRFGWIWPKSGWIYWPRSLQISLYRRRQSPSLLDFQPKCMICDRERTNHWLDQVCQFLGRPNRNSNRRDWALALATCS